MTTSTVAFDPFDDDGSTPKATPYKYDLRLEIGVKEEGMTVPVVAIFYDFVKHLKSAADDEAPVAVLTATDKLFFENRDMSPEEFQKAFKVDNSEGKTSKVLLGFKLHTLTKLSDLKHRLMHTYLIPHNLFLRQQPGGFAHGVKSYSYGFLKDDHPDHPDLSMLKQRYSRIAYDAWKKVDREDQAKWRKECPDVFFGNTGIIIPVHFTKERISASMEGKDKINTSALVVSTPTKYGKLLKQLLDIALASKRLNNLIPFALNRENPEGYYFMTAHQARFMENHRNIPLLNVPPDADTKPGQKGATLLHVLNAHLFVQRVSYDHVLNKYHVSTTATHYRELHQWITNAFSEHKFPYSPQIRPTRYGSGSSSVNGTSYSDIFKEAMSQASENLEASPPCNPPKNPWKSRPPLAISYDISDAAFPFLPRKNPTPSSPSTTSETIDEDTIQSAISVAIKKLEEQHRAELAQLKLEMQAKIEEVTTQMKELGQQVALQTYEALVSEASPIVTKTDQVTLQQDISVMKTQLSAMMSMFQNIKFIPANIDGADNTSSMTPPATIIAKTRSSSRNLKRKPSSTPEKGPTNLEDPFTQDHSLSSAASSSVASMEGCED